MPEKSRAPLRVHGGSTGPGEPAEFASVSEVVRQIGSSLTEGCVGVTASVRSGWTLLGPFPGASSLTARPTLERGRQRE